MNIYIARHGETDWNKKGILLGNTDIPLNSTGKHQALLLKENLNNINFNRIICSDLKRAVETAQIINNNSPIIKNSNLRERYYGLLEGTTPTNIGDYWKIEQNLNSNSVESLKDFLNRIFSELDNIIQKYNSDENILIVTHHGVVMAIFAYFSSKFDYCFDNFNFKNCEYKKFEL